MRKSRLNTHRIYNNSNEVIENVLQASIVNNGTNDVVIFGQTLKTNEIFRIDASNTVFSLELEQIHFLTSGNATQNNVSIAYQTLQAENC